MAARESSLFQPRRSMNYSGSCNQPVMLDAVYREPGVARIAARNGPKVLLISKLVDGNYPNYRQVIPSDFKQRITLVREELLHALRRAEIMTSEKSNSVKLTFASNNLAIGVIRPKLARDAESLAINYKGAGSGHRVQPGIFAGSIEGAG